MCCYAFVLPQAFSQINGCKTQKYTLRPGDMLRPGDIAYLAYIAKCAVSGLSRLS